MKGFVYIDHEKIGEVDFVVVDESMGAIGGDFVAYKSYDQYQSSIQSHYEEKGISNIDDYNFRIFLDNIELKPLGGIGVTDSKEYNEIYVDVAGLDQGTIEKVNGI